MIWYGLTLNWQSLFPFNRKKNLRDSVMKGKQFVCFSNIWLLSVHPRDVLLKGTRLLARETALIAGVGLFSGVSALVYFKITRLSARIVALITLERFLS